MISEEEKMLASKDARNTFGIRKLLAIMPLLETVLSVLIIPLSYLPGLLVEPYPLVMSIMK